jgi:dTDP-glucose 4,6-dehydratase
MNIIITGGLGFIGLYVVEEFQNKFPESNIFIIDALKYNTTPYYKTKMNKNTKLVIQDINEYNSLYENIKRINPCLIIHLAAETNVDHSYSTSSSFIQTNIIGTFNILESVRLLCPTCTFIHMSTDEIYGSMKTKNKEYISENGHFNPTNPYSASKASAEMLVNAYTISYNLNSYIIRCNNAYGARQYPEKIIPKFTTYILEGKRCEIHGDGNFYSRHYIHASDIAKAINIIYTKGYIYKENNRPNIFNISSDYEYTNFEILKIILNILKPDKSLHESYVEVKDRPFNDTHYPIDCSKLKSLGFTPEKSWEEGIKETVLWYKENFKTWWDNNTVI